MRFYGWLLSLALHAAVVALAIWAPKPAPLKIDLSLPVYTVDLLTLSGPKGGPGPAPAPVAAPAPEPKAEPEPEPEPEKAAVPIKPEPKPVEIKQPPKEPEKPKKPEAPPPKPKEPEKPKPPKAKPAAKPKPKPKPPKPKLTPEEELAQAMKKAQQEAAKKPKPAVDPVAQELAALQQAVSAEDAQTGGGGQGGQNEGGAGAVSLVAVYGQIVEQLIKENWRYPMAASRQNLQASVEIALDNDGSILNYTLVRPSGRPEFDASVQRAVDQTETLPAPPKEELKTLIINFNLQEMVQ